MPAPPFTIDNINPDSGNAKRCAVGTDTGISLAPGASPTALFHIVYRENFRFHRFYKLESDTPYWSADADGRWNSTPREGTLSAGTLVVQTELSDVARKKSQLGHKQQTKLVLCQRDNAALAPDMTPKHPQIWVPLENHPDNDKTWQKPRLLKNAPLNQWGIRGDFDFKLDPFGSAPTVEHFKMVTVWERWTKCEAFPCGDDDPKRESHWCQGLFTLRPGVYAAYVKVMPKHSSDDERKKFPSIKVAWGWDEATNAWVKDAPSAKNEATRRPGCFIHPGSKPTAFLGCISPGPIDKATPWGFWQVKHCRKTMWSILEDMGVDEAKFKTLRHPGPRNAVWVLIRVDDPDDVCGIREAEKLGLKPSDLGRHSPEEPTAEAA